MYSKDNERKRNIDLDLLEERRIVSQLKSKSFKEGMKQTHDKRISKRPIKIGVWILQKIKGTTRLIQANKLIPNSEGPYLVNS